MKEKSIKRISDTALSYYSDDAQNEYFKFPKFLFTEESAKELSVGAKVLYSLLLDRSRLSAKNDWTDEEGRVFVRFTLSDATRLLSCTVPTAIKVYRELEEAGLIEKKKIRKGCADIIFVKSYTPKISHNLENYFISL